MNRRYRLYQWIILSITLLVSLIGCTDMSKDRIDIDVRNDHETAIEERNEKDKSSENDSIMEVHFLDVGQGDCTLIICDNYTMLVDAGDDSKGTEIQLYLTKLGIKKLDYVIGTHPDSDHIGGLDVILYKFDCETIIMPDYEKDTRAYDDVIQVMKDKNYRNTPPFVGTTYELGSASFTIIAPNGNYGDNANEYSIGFQLCHGENEFIFMGDAEENSEMDILMNELDVSANVYKVSHHGSKSASTEEFLEAMNPEYAVISCGEGNRYGHPHAQTLNTLRTMGIQVFRTDEQGGIIATSDGREIAWNCSPSETWQVGEGVKSDRENDKTSKSAGKGESKYITEGTTYIINTNTMKFHHPSCSSVNEMAEKNKREVTQNRDELIGQGYSPCSKCLSKVKER